MNFLLFVLTISAFHDKIDGVKVGSHPLVSDLLSWVFNMNPPTHRYNFIWDVQQVLDYIRINLGENAELTNKLLTLELTILLALTLASRSSSCRSTSFEY